MDDVARWEELTRVAARLGIEVRVEPFETPPAGGGGPCRLAGRALVLVDRAAPAAARVEALARALAVHDLEAVYMAPEVRRLLEAVREAGRLEPAEGVPLAPLTTLALGGPARFLVEARDEATVREALAWADRHHTPVHVLGGGSNVVVADAGVAGLVLRVGLRGIAVREMEGAVLVSAAAGEPWDELVALAVGHGWAGLECLSGIPGLVGATPIQNVGAYGQEVADTIVAVRVMDRASGRVGELDRAACRFGYRDSVFRTAAPERHVILGVTYRLRPGGVPAVRHAELGAHLAAHGRARPTTGEVREAVLAVRRAKSMVLEPGDPNRRSCGSFFLNPVVSPDEAERVARIAGEPGPPRWPAPGGVKLPAAWLIERAGFPRGHRAGPVGLSSRHALAIVAHEGARAADVVRLAARVRAAVMGRFGVRLWPEPAFWGFGRLDEGLPVAEEGS
jgi:UDP-N-acetylmuramate dehydrogenase